LFFAVALQAMLVLPAIAQAEDSQKSWKAGDYLGRWLTESGNFEVEIAACGSALCGTVVQVHENRSMNGTKMAPATVSSTLGMKILIDFVPTASGEWKGEIYNRENGKSYACIMTLAAADQLKVHPYVGSPLLGKTQIWHRVAPTAVQG